MASKVTYSIDHMRLDPMSICLESQSVFQCLFLDPVFDRYNIVDFVTNFLLSALPGEDGRAPELRSVCWLDTVLCLGLLNQEGNILDH